MEVQQLFRIRLCRNCEFDNDTVQCFIWPPHWQGDHQSLVDLLLHLPEFPGTTCACVVKGMKLNLNGTLYYYGGWTLKCGRGGAAVIQGFTALHWDWNVLFVVCKANRSISSSHRMWGKVQTEERPSNGCLLQLRVYRRSSKYVVYKK